MNKPLSIIIILLAIIIIVLMSALSRKAHAASIEKETILIKRQIELEKQKLEIDKKLFDTDQQLKLIKKLKYPLMEDEKIDLAIKELEQHVKSDPKWRISLKYYIMISSTDPDQHIDSSDGIGLTGQYKKITIGLTWEEIAMKLAGQSGDRFTLIGLTAGTRQPFLTGFHFWANIGGYMTQGDGVLHDTIDTVWEGYARFANGFAYNDADKRFWDNYMSEFSPGIGGNIGIDYSIKLTEKFLVNAGLSHRYLKLPWSIYCFDDANAGGERWDFKLKKDLGGTFAFAGGEYQFTERFKLIGDVSGDVNNREVLSELKLSYNF